MENFLHQSERGTRDVAVRIETVEMVTYALTA